MKLKNDFYDLSVHVCLLVGYAEITDLDLIV